MARNRSIPWLIAYDISDPRRLQRFHRFLRQHATPVQYSVFLYVASHDRARHFATTLEDRIDPRHDDLRLYPLPASPEYQTLGRSHPLAGVQLFGNGVTLGLTGEPDA
ncbi:CRISPR-associated endonuclease Cas2 [Thioalkalivibrio sp. ALE11]|uniref:CRISPR-associated endonuclease Cas2 n=1 Tax=Thioalkalivibrio sp. ALE11 TaxID=1265494 RepID=UPI00037C2EC8|nr:CRISPR-associated endonuclease Cas2 [Thioalkalivibrio sp. ALE11]